MTGATLLWALRSPCNMGCRYCYFGTIDDHRDAPPAHPGVLSHLSRADLRRDEIDAFIQTLCGSRVKRIFLAGGEPLIWPPIMEIVEAIKAANVQVVLCTNGTALERSPLVGRIVSACVDGVSVSLDSIDAGYNDAWRPANDRVTGHGDVVRGVRALLAARGTRPYPRVGLYAVVSRLNIGAVFQVASLAADLGCDYFVPQPIALDASHPLHKELSLTAADDYALRQALGRLYSEARVSLPPSTYAGQFVRAVTQEGLGVVPGCFGGADLFFIEPDGSVWDCPSSLKIAATLPHERRNIRGANARELFGRPDRCTDCRLFSRDCVNMWPLMSFGGFLHSDGGHREL